MTYPAVLVLFGLPFLLGNLTKLTLFRPDIHFTPLDIVLGSTLIALLLTRFSRLVHIVRNWKPASALVLFFALALISLLASGSRYGPTAMAVGFLYWLRYAVYSFSFTAFAILTTSNLRRHFFTFLAFSTSLICLLQYLFFPDVRFLQVAEWDPHYFRVVGPFLDPGFTGLILVFILIWLNFRRFRNRLVYFLLWAAAYLSFALTYSRSSYLAFVLSQAYISYLQKSAKRFLLILLLFGLTLLLLPRPGGEGVKLERTSSTAARIINWQQSFTVFTDHPFLGIGFNAYRYAQKTYGFLDNLGWLKSHAGAGADSSLLFVAATTGILGLTAYLFFLGSLWRSSSPVLKCSLVALFFHSFFLNSQFYPPVLFWLAVLIADIKADK